MRPKLTTLSEAAALVEDGMVIALAADADMAPMALVREVIRSRRANLAVVLAAGGLSADMLIGAGCVTRFELGSLEVTPFGSAPNFRRHVESGGSGVEDWDTPFMLARLQAGAMGVPFVPVRGVAGSDLLRVGAGFRAIDDPFHPGEKTFVVPALTPDVALLHGYRADQYGNVVLAGDQDSRVIALAARRAIVTVEELVEQAPSAGPGEVFVSGMHVAAIVHAPLAAHPTACPGYYLEDFDGLKEYMTAATTPETFAEYLDRYVFKAPSLQAYLTAAGAFGESVPGASR